ncbi:MAG: hypothetical protein M1828_004211 [Chrysothrix sp. TS-e1954]|nr:MAG: hypothetical protein M1828_004211 [Chrysothrix sp. TS-e1954]
MPYDLQNRKVLVTAGSRGLGAAVCHKFAAEGSSVAINYNSNTEAAESLAKDLASKYPKGKFVVLQGGFTKFSTFGDLSGNSEEDWDKCWAVNVKGQMALLRAALPTFNANPDGGAFIITSSIAGVKLSGSSMPYSVTKAAGLHLMKCLASTQGPKIRVNAVLPGLLLTEWGLKYSPEMIQAIKDRSVLKQETDIEDCANAFVMVAKNSSMTGMKIQVDGGVAVDSA